MSADLNDVMLAIGALQAQEKEATQQREKMWTQLHQINGKLDELDRLRQRGWGILAGVALTGGGFGAAVSKLLGN